MANTFRSKEVYKKLRKEVHNRNTMVAVEGVYVSGQYRPPYYANPMLVINQIQCNKADVIPYTDDIVEAYDDFTYGIMDIITSNNISITACPPNNHNMTPEPMLRITQINSTKATIT